MFSKLFSNKSIAFRRIVILLLCIGFFMFLRAFNNIDRIQLTNQNGTGYEKAVVQEVTRDNVQSDGSRTGSQRVKVRILTGELKGKVLDATSISGYLYGADCKENMKVIVSTSTSGKISVVSVYSYYRAPIIYAFVGLFLLIIWAVGGKKGFKSAVGIVFTFICIIFLFIPMLYKGYSPFLSAVIVDITITVVIIYLIGGFSIKTLASILGTVIGVMIAGGVATGFGYLAHINGYNVSAVEELVFVANNTNLKVGGILFAGILIASLGAVMDVSISVASSINEVYNTNTNISRKELFSSGMNVGRDIMGANANTLILAYTGGALNTLILIYVYSMKYNQIINMYSIGIEIMQGLSGTIAVILTVPLVSFIASVLLTSDKLKSTLRRKI